jgi:hypothetical protein
MKTKLKNLICVLVLLTGMSMTASAQIYVKLRPSRPVIVRTVSPGPQYIWVQDEWEPNGVVYRYSGGHWVIPPQKGVKWKKGHWKKYPKSGYLWVPGKWIRVR